MNQEGLNLNATISCLERLTQPSRAPTPYLWNTHESSDTQLITSHKHGQTEKELPWGSIWMETQTNFARPSPVINW